jgi:hypothetical protein
MTDRTVRDRQATAVTALADLLTRDLPPLRWEVRPYAALYHLQAQPGGGDAEALRSLHAWALSLGVDVVSTEYEDHVSHEVRAEHMSAEIRIFAHTAVTYEYRCVTKEATR